MLIKDLKHKERYRELFSMLGYPRVAGKDKEKACLYLAALDDDLFNGIKETKTTQIFSKCSDNILSRVALFILEKEKESLTLKEIMGSEYAAYIMQALFIAYPCLRTGHLNVHGAGRKTTYKESDIRAVIMDRENGMSFNELSKKYNIPKSTIQYHCKSAKKVR